MVKFAKFTPAEQKEVDKIIARAVEAGKQNRVVVDKISLEMDISAAHAQHPLRLTDLANADDFTFSHDVFGIMRHMDRRTGTLKDCFVPRMARG